MYVYPNSCSVWCLFHGRYIRLRRSGNNVKFQDSNPHHRNGILRYSWTHHTDHPRHADTVLAVKSRFVMMFLG